MTVRIQTSVKDPEKIRERRAQIVAAAVRLFAEKGFHKTTTREIAQASGLSTGAVYEYVASKEDILFLVCQHIHQEMERQLRASLREHASAAERLRHAIQAFFRVINEMQEDVLLIYQESKSLPGPLLHEVLQDEARITRVFEQLLREGAADGSLNVDPAAIPLIAHDIVVCGQMWAFRRWALREFDVETFTAIQTRMLIQACGVEVRHLGRSDAHGDECGGTAGGGPQRGRREGGGAGHSGESREGTIPSAPPGSVRDGIQPV